MQRDNQRKHFYDILLNLFLINISIISSQMMHSLKFEIF